MSNFFSLTRNPDTGQFEEAEWLDDYYGRHEYAVRFPSTGVVVPASALRKEERDTDGDEVLTQELGP